MALYRRKVYSRRVDGMLVVRTRRHDPRIDFLLEAGFPFVAFGRSEGKDYPWVDVDGVDGLRQAVDHLAGLGHRLFAYLSAPLDLLFGTLRLQGFRQGMEGHGLPIEERWIVTGDLTQRKGYQLAGELLDQPQRPTAIIAANDPMALGVMAAAQQRNLVVGRDVSVMGFDDIPLAEHAHPSLTTIHQPIYRIGTMITAMLIRSLNDQPLESHQVLLQPELVTRESTGRVPAT
jgi:LacI family transcriptional regulator